MRRLGFVDLLLLLGIVLKRDPIVLWGCKAMRLLGFVVTAYFLGAVCAKAIREGDDQMVLVSITALILGLLAVK